jgi:hypothetical protein
LQELLGPLDAAQDHVLVRPSHVRGGGDGAGLCAWSTGTKNTCVSAPGSPASPRAASWAKGGAAKPGTCCCVPRHGPAPGRPTAKGVSNVDSAVLTPGNEGLSKVDSAVPAPRLREARAPGRPRAASSWSPGSRGPPGEEGRGSSSDGADASGSPAAAGRTAAGPEPGVWLRASRCHGSVQPDPLPSHLPRTRAVLWGEGQARQMTSGRDPAPRVPGSLSGPPRRSAPVALEPPDP